MATWGMLGHYNLCHRGHCNTERAQQRRTNTNCCRAVVLLSGKGACDSQDPSTGVGTIAGVRVFSGIATGTGATGHIRHVAANPSQTAYDTRVGQIRNELRVGLVSKISRLRPLQQARPADLESARRVARDRAIKKFAEISSPSSNSCGRPRENARTCTPF